ncbi:ABC1 kinase family protein [Luteibacter sp. RCC_6_2]|uniref:ABC1 kinase family protein n=1 Tax=Luteibacter sp. RCC_6_2 TaxID=3239223 RepID=UPI0035266147
MLASTRRYRQIASFVLKYRRAGVLRSPTDPMATAPERDAASPEQFARDIESLGPAFIKLAQALSTRPDLVAPPYLVALQRMQDAVVEVPKHSIAALIEQELGAPVSTLYADFDENPLAAGSLAQVHAAHLLDGSRVAVKVQRPGIEADVASDLDLLARVARLAEGYTDAGRRLGIEDWVAALRDALAEELDFLAEADNLDALGRVFALYPSLTVPKPHRGLSTRRVLTMDLISGRKVAPGMAGADQGRVLGEALMRAYLDQVFAQGRVHADPHPGNVLIADDGRLAVIDAGMITYLSRTARVTLLRIMLHAINSDGDIVADLCESMGRRLPDYDRQRYRRAVRSLVGRYAARGDDRAFAEGSLLLDLTSRGAECGLQPPPELSVLGKTLINLEATLCALDPSLPTRRIVEDQLESLLMKQVSDHASKTGVAALALDVYALSHGVPSKLSRFVDTLADNDLRIRVDGLEESHLIENLQKIANRISIGLISSALIVGAALLTRNGADDLPTWAAILFGLAALLGLALIVNAWRVDRVATRKGTIRRAGHS